MRIPGLTLIVAGIALLPACRKDDTLKKIPPPVSITVINATLPNSTIVSMFGPDTAGKYFAGALKINYGAAQLYSTVSGKIPLRITTITDTTHNLFNNTLDLAGNGIYNLYLAGDTTHPDTIITRDNIPSYQDSAAGVRFINLATGGKSININLLGDSAHPVASLGYTHASDFIKYPATPSSPTSYKFEIRDAATGDLLTTMPYTWTYSRFNNHTIVIAGSTDPLSPVKPKVFAVSNF